MTTASPAPTPWPTLRRPDGSPLRVLVVDDERNIAELLTMAPRLEGWDVTVARTGAGAVSEAVKTAPDVAVCLTHAGVRRLRSRALDRAGDRGRPRGQSSSVWPPI